MDGNLVAAGSVIVFFGSLVSTVLRKQGVRLNDQPAAVWLADLGGVVTTGVGGGIYGAQKGKRFAESRGIPTAVGVAVGSGVGVAGGVGLSIGSAVGGLVAGVAVDDASGRLKGRQGNGESFPEVSEESADPVVDPDVSSPEPEPEPDPAVAAAGVSPLEPQNSDVGLRQRKPYPDTVQKAKTDADLQHISAWDGNIAKRLHVHSIHEPSLLTRFPRCAALMREGGGSVDRESLARCVRVFKRERNSATTSSDYEFFSERMGRVEQELDSSFDGSRFHGVSTVLERAIMKEMGEGVSALSRAGV